MQFVSALSHNGALRTAVQQATESVRAELSRADAIFVFASSAYGRELAVLPSLLEDAFPEATYRVGCTGGGIVGGFRELESHAGLSIIAAQLPGVTLHGGHVSAPDLPGPDAPPDHWAQAFSIPRTAGIRGLVVLTDPFHMPCQDLLVGLDYAWPGVPKVGGIASGSRNPEDHVLFDGRRSHRAGAIVLGLEGAVSMQPVVAQGCRPIGSPGRVSQADASRLVRIDRGTAVEWLYDTVHQLSERDQDRARQGNLFLGLAHDPLGMAPAGPGTYLIRQLIGIQPEQGSFTVAGQPTIGSTVQFHLRDAESSSSDLRAALESVCDRPRPAGALMFSCLGRGEHLYGEPNHDSTILKEVCGPVPTGGFFCNGEIGPVGEQTHLHGFTASFAMFRPA